MPSKLPITTLRLQEPTNSKIRHIANQNHRKLNDEITMIIEKHIQMYEYEHGEIKIEKEEP